MSFLCPETILQILLQTTHQTRIPAEAHIMGADQNHLHQAIAIITAAHQAELVDNKTKAIILNTWVPALQANRTLITTDLLTRRVILRVHQPILTVSPRVIRQVTIPLQSLVATIRRSQRLLTVTTTTHQVAVALNQKARALAKVPITTPIQNLNLQVRDRIKPLDLVVVKVTVLEEVVVVDQMFPNTKDKTRRN